jgi:carbon monoxide dehydrogenase subunit G
MATIFKEIFVDASPEAVWAALRDVGTVHQVAPGLLTDCYMDGDARIVTFGNGAVLRELIVGVDDASRRVVYAMVDGPMNATHHNASMQVFDNGTGSRVVWITDILPDGLKEPVSGIVEQASGLMKQTLESQAAPS